MYICAMVRAAIWHRFCCSTLGTFTGSSLFSCLLFSSLPMVHSSNQTPSTSESQRMEVSIGCPVSIDSRPT